MRCIDGADSGSCCRLMGRPRNLRRRLLRAIRSRRRNRRVVSVRRLAGVRKKPRRVEILLLPPRRVRA